MEDIVVDRSPKGSNEIQTKYTEEKTLVVVGSIPKLSGQRQRTAEKSQGRIVKWTEDRFKSNAKAKSGKVNS